MVDGIGFHESIKDRFTSLSRFMSAYARSQNLKAWREAVGANVRRLRRASSMSQAVLAESAGLSPAYVSMMERGLANPRLETLTALAHALNTSPVDILNAALPEQANDTSATD